MNSRILNPLWLFQIAVLVALQLNLDAVAQEPAANAPTTAPLPTEWIDPATGHRIIRLSREDGSLSLYFHQNAYTPDGKKLLITSPTGLYTIDPQTRAIEPLVHGRVNVIVTGRKTGRIFYRRDDTILAADPKTGRTEKIVDLPSLGDHLTINISTVNADETLLGGTVTDQSGAAPVPTDAPPPAKERQLQMRFDQHLPMDLLTIETATGTPHRFAHSTDWLNHVQFSPTDPQVLLFCHEGPWHKVDRSWTIRADASKLRQVHQRTMSMEIEGHEFFSQDGRSIWYDLQTPRGEDFWLAGYNLATQGRTWYHLQRDEWSVHFNISPDGKLFAGDGGGPNMVAHATDGKWIYLFTPELLPDHSAPEINPDQMIHPGILHAQRLVNMSRHDYALEPNVTFTPDMKWIVFRSNMLGPTHVFAVELAKSPSP